MTTKELVKKVWDRAEPLCGENGLSLWDVTFEKEGRSWYLNVFIDRDDGVSTSDCETVSRGLDPFLDEKQFDSLPPYMLVVSSAGLERRLNRPEHFVWAEGKDVDVSFYKARDGVMSLTAVLRQRDGDRLVLEQNGTLLELSMADVAAVRLHFEI